MRVISIAAIAVAAIALAAIAGRDTVITRVAPQIGATPATPPSSAAIAVRAGSSIAGHPDRGLLFTEDRSRRTVRSGASTWRPVRVSEAHALRAIAAGGMTIEAPNGQAIRLQYERHVEHADGNWTWVGREAGAAPGTESVVTFGEKAVFGLIRQGNADLKLTTEAGSTWLVETDDSKVDDNRVAASADDFLMPAAISNPMAAGALAPSPQGSAARVSAVEPAGAVAAQVSSQRATTVDLAVGYTTGFATRLGGKSQALTRIDYLVELANQAYVASGIGARVRIVHTVQVNYPDATLNHSALFELTGVDCTTQADGDRYLASRRVACLPVARPAGLEPLAAARDTYGADLMMLVRKFEDPENASCGTAWLLGGGQNPIDADSAAFGVSITSDSSGETFPDNGHTCPELHLAHELGHNMGQQHDVVTASGTDDSDTDGSLLDAEEYGRHPYSFGYSTDGTANDFFTIMSIRRTGQTRYRVFANPRISTCGGAPCGTAGQSDNARSMSETIPILAAFRDTVVPFMPDGDFNGDAHSDILWRNTSSGLNAIWRSGSNATQQPVTAVTSQAWQVAGTGDFDGDGRSDILWRNSTNGQNAIWRSANNATQQPVTAVTSQAWQVAGTGDFNGDGQADILWRNGTNGQNAIWRSANNATQQPVTAVTSQAWQVAGVGDFNGDGRSDILWRSSADGKNAIWRSGNFATQQTTVAMSTSWIVAGIGDFNDDGISDILWRNTADGRNAIWHSGNSTTSMIVTAVTNQAWKVAKIGDFDHDGHADILWRNTTDGKNAIWKAGNFGTQQAVTAVPLSWVVAG